MSIRGEFLSVDEEGEGEKRRKVRKERGRWEGKKKGNEMEDEKWWRENWGSNHVRSDSVRERLTSTL